MGYVFTLLYTSLTILSPADLLPTLAPYRIMVWLGIGGMFLSLMAIPGGTFTIRSPQLALIAGFLASIAFSRMMQGWMGGAYLALLNFLPAVMVFFLVIINVTNARRLRILAVVIFAVTLYLVAAGAMAYHQGELDNPLIYPQDFYDEDRELVTILRVRSYGFLNDPNDFAQFLLISIPFVALMWRKGHAIWNFFFVLSPVVLLLYGVYLTRSRGALVGLVVLAAFAAKERFGYTAASAASVAVLLGLLVLNFAGGRALSMREMSALGRIFAWSDGLQMLKRNPVAGVGFNNFMEHHERTAHNSFVLCFAELGLVGYFFWLGLIIITVMQLRGLVAAAPPDDANRWLRRWANAILLALYCFLATSWFLSRTYATTLYLLLGMAAALLQIARHQGLDFRQLFSRWLVATGAAEVASIVAVYVTLRLRAFLP